MRIPIATIMSVAYCIHVRGESITLYVAGGLFAVNGLYEIVGGGPVEFDRKKADRHVITREENNRISAILVRPRNGKDGLTGAILSMPGGKMLISGRELSLNEQAIAFAIIRNIAL